MREKFGIRACIMQNRYCESFPLCTNVHNSNEFCACVCLWPAAGEGRWEQLRASGDTPTCLQEHTAVAYKDCLYVFGGEVGFSAASETPLWVYQVRTNSWRKVRAQKGVSVPRGRRGHTALVYQGAMIVYGGYQDLRGSSSELWAFDFSKWENINYRLLSRKNC